jgi:uncharacterized membrane protein
MSVSKKLGLPSIREYLARPRKVRDVNTEHRESISRLERMAIYISDHIGTPGFFFLILLWTVVWLSWNLLAPPSWQFDKPMSFVFWLFISNCIQIFLMPLIMVAQNLQSRHTDLRAENDYEVNKAAAASVEIILQHIRYQTHQMAALAEKLELPLVALEPEPESAPPPVEPSAA